MTNVTQILSEIEHGDLAAAEQLLPLVYDELRKLASVKLASEKPGQTLQATALVHEAYLRLVGSELRQQWDSRGHFFVAAAEAMRRILIENARRKASLKRGGDHKRIELADVSERLDGDQLDLLALDEALRKLEAEQPSKAQLIRSSDGLLATRQESRGPHPVRPQGAVDGQESAEERGAVALPHRSG